jgi:hypothetical protein
MLLFFFWDWSSVYHILLTYATTKECAIRLSGEETGLPDNALVYYVKVQGPFTTTMIPLPPQAKSFPPAPFGIEVFDAQTGNFL